MIEEVLNKDHEFYFLQIKNHVYNLSVSDTFTTNECYIIAEKWNLHGVNLLKV